MMAHILTSNDVMDALQRIKRPIIIVNDLSMRIKVVYAPDEHEIDLLGYVHQINGDNFVLNISNGKKISLSDPIKYENVLSIEAKSSPFFIPDISSYDS